MCITRYTVRGRGAKRRTSSALPTTYLPRLWFKTTCIRLAAYARSRQFEENSQEVPYQGGSGGLLNWRVFQTFIKKIHIWWLKKVPWTDCSHSLTTLTAIHFVITQNPRLKPPRSSSRVHAFWSPSQSWIIFRSRRRRTSEFDVQHGWKKRFAQQAVSEHYQVDLIQLFTLSRENVSFWPSQTLKIRKIGIQDQPSEGFTKDLI